MMQAAPAGDEDLSIARRTTVQVFMKAVTYASSEPADTSRAPVKSQDNTSGRVASLLNISDQQLQRKGSI